MNTLLRAVVGGLVHDEKTQVCWIGAKTSIQSNHLILGAESYTSNQEGMKQ